MAQLTYSGTWSKEGLATSPLRVPRVRASPRSRSRSVHSPQRSVPPQRGIRFASGHYSPMRPVQLFQDDYSADWESEDSLYFEESPMARRTRSPAREHSRREHGRERERNYERGAKLTWLRLSIDVFVALLALTLTIKALLTLRSDLGIKYAQARADLVAEIDSCRKSYSSNYCRDNAPPALAQVCQEWEKCMNLDPDKAGQVRATAAALGEIIEAFVGRLDLRSMVVLLGLTIVALVWRG